RRVGPRLRRELQRPRMLPRRSRLGMALGVEQLEELVRELRPQQLPQERVELGVRALAVGRKVGVAQDLRHRQQRGIEVLDQAPPQHRIPEHADDDQDREQQAAVPERQTGADRQRAQPHSASPSMYPAPRTVWSRRRSPSPSILRRRYPTYTSMML